MNVINALFIVINQIIKAVLKIFTPIFIILIILVAIKIIYRYKKYGKKEFDIFRKREMTKFSDIIINIIKKIDNKILYIEKDNLYSDIVLITNTGIYLLKIMQHKGLIFGKRNEKTLNNKLKNNIEIEIENPFYYMEEDKNTILSIDNNLKIYQIVITNNVVNINIDNVDKEEIISLQKFYYKIENYLKQKKIYEEEYVRNLLDKIDNI